MMMILKEHLLQVYSVNVVTIYIFNSNQPTSCWLPKASTTRVGCCYNYRFCSDLFSCSMNASFSFCCRVPLSIQIQFVLSKNLILLVEKCAVIIFDNEKIQKINLKPDANCTQLVHRGYSLFSGEYQIYFIECGEKNQYFSRVRSTSENADIFTTRDEIYLVFAVKK